MSTSLHRFLRVVIPLLLLLGSVTTTAAQVPLPAGSLQSVAMDSATPVFGLLLSSAGQLPSRARHERNTDQRGWKWASWTIIVLLTFLTLIPSLLLCMTPFARLLIVFHFLRQALGLQTTPTNQTLIGLSLVLTFFLMQPVAADVYQTSVEPLQSGQITAFQAVERGEAPVREFMLHYVREKDVALFVELSKEPRPASPKRPLHESGHACLYLVRAENRLSNRNCFVPAVPGDRHDCRIDFHLSRDAATASRSYFYSIKAVAICDGGWLEPVGRISHEEFSLGAFN